jgi:hypothetical protein
MTKLRWNQYAAYEIEFSYPGGTFDGRPSHRLMPIVLAGGPAIEVNKRALVENYERIFNEAAGDLPPIRCRCRVVYTWRSRQHVLRWLSKSPEGFWKIVRDRRV